MRTFPGHAADGRTPGAAAAAAAAPQNSRQATGGPASGAGPTRFAPDTARRDLDVAMQQAAGGSGNRSRPGSGAAGAPGLEGQQAHGVRYVAVEMWLQLL